jgi:acyl-CoA synthetase (AMP-forming)/AMP-acid ligase II
VLSGAAPLGNALTEAVERRLGCPVGEAFGMTKMSGTTHLVPPFSGSHKTGSIGPPIPGVECRLVDPNTGEQVPAGERGEIWMRSTRVIHGYLNNSLGVARRTSHGLSADYPARASFGLEGPDPLDTRLPVLLERRLERCAPHADFDRLPGQRVVIVKALGQNDECEGEILHVFAGEDLGRGKGRGSLVRRARA